MRAKLLIFAAIAAANFARGQYGPIPAQPGMPFSADQTLSQVQILPDGRHVIPADQQSKLYRDSAGRTRLDMFISSSNPAQQAHPALMNITIFDGVAGARYLLNPTKKTAQKFPLPKLSDRPKPPDLAALLAMIPAGMAQGGPAGMAPDTEDSKSPPSDNEALGKRTMEGVTAVGRRTTMRLPGAKTGDPQIITVFEAWESPELGMMMILTKHTDSRTGELTTRMTNIHRGEPDAALFVVPADYTIVEAAPPQVRPATPAR